MKRRYCAIMLTLLITLSISILAVPRAYSAETTVDISPKQNGSFIGESFTINVSATNAAKLNAWQLYLLFDPAMLNCTDIWVPSNNIFAPYEILWFPPKINNTIGSILAFCALNGTFGVNASGTLCQIEFTCKAPGITVLDIANKMQYPSGTYLQDSDLNFIPFEATDGVVEVGAPGFKENIFEVTQNSEIYHIIVFTNSTVTSFNYDQALKIMTFDVTGSDGSNGSSHVAVSKELLNGTILVLMGNKATPYTMCENKTHNFLRFTYTHSTKNVRILLTIIGDVNGDRLVDLRDLFYVIRMYLTSDPIADLNRDGLVDLRDIFITVKNYGKTWTP